MYIMNKYLSCPSASSWGNWPSPSERQSTPSWQQQQHPQPANKKKNSIIISIKKDMNLSEYYCLYVLSRSDTSVSVCVCVEYKNV
jgi:hypothetical protein